MADPTPQLLDVTVAQRLGLPVRDLVRYCRQGHVSGATFDRACWHWRIPYPVRVSLCASALPR